MSEISSLLSSQWQPLLGWVSTHGVSILVILIGALVIKKYSHILIRRLICRIVVSQGSSQAEQQREETLIRVLNGTVGVLVSLIGGMMILSEVGIAVGPLIAAAGVVGLAFGFGGQYLIRDLISGLFIILENQYRVNDVVTLDGTSGLVEDINLRLTKLRDLDGTVHYIPNGAITKASNLTRDFSRVNLDIGVSYSANLEKVIAVVNAVGKELAEDPAWKDSIVKAPEFLRVTDFADSAVVIKILGDTMPIKQWDVAGELRMRLKIAFDREGIEIPFPQRTMHIVGAAQTMYKEKTPSK